MRILLVTPESEEQRTLSGWFVEAGHECVCATDIMAAAGLGHGSPFDVVVCDEEVSSGDDFTLAELTPFVSRRPFTIVTGIRIGDGHETTGAVLANQLRVLAEALESDSGRPRQLFCQDLVLEPATRRGTRCGIDLGLTHTEYRVLECLVRHAGTVVTRRMLCSHVWSPEWHGVTNVVDVYVSRVRRKVDRGFDVPLVHTIRGLGYRLGPER
jgi:two-component system OmpR family response regulator